ncbi:MAG: hypothetical protein AD742_05175 [Methylibium sp. NZG]|nr:MAG: hypothetical protein AD742_05175 [Methylibium sp. NZG]
MRLVALRRSIAAAFSALLLWQLAACGAGDSGSGPTFPVGASPATAAHAASTGQAGSGSADRIDAAHAQGDINAEQALTYKVFGLFGDARLPARYQGAAGDESDSDVLEEASAAFATLSAGTQQVIAPFLQRPATLGSWSSAALVQAGGAARATANRAQAGVGGCGGQAARWATVPAGSAQVKVWYDSSVAGDHAAAQGVADAIDTQVWPGLMSGLGTQPAPDDRSELGCDGGDARLDVYLVHGLVARSVAVPAAGGADPSSVFVLVNADRAAETPANAAQGVMSALRYARQVGTEQVGASDRRRALAQPAAAGRVTALSTPALPVPAVVQLKAVSLSYPVVTVALDAPVTAGNWIAVAVSTLGATPANVALSDNQSRSNLNFAAAGLRYGSSFGTTWRYARLSNTGAYTLTVNRASATSGTVQVFELGNVDGATFLDVGAVAAGGTSTTPATTFRASRTPNDLLLSVVAVRSPTAAITPTAPVGTALADTARTSLATSSVMTFNTSALGTYRMAASLAASSQWRMSSLAVRGAKAPPVVAVPTNTAPPVVTVVDNISALSLASTPGTWADAPTSYAYSWTRNGAPIAGAVLASYTTTVQDQGTSVAAVVTASNSAGAASAASLAVPVPVPGPPQVPSVALTATPASVVQGQPSTLAWSSTAAASCTATGAWSGAKAANGSAAVTPGAPATYTLECIGPGGTATASATVDVTVPPPGSTPTLGASALVFHFSKGSLGPWLTTPPLNTQSGSTVLGLVAKGSVWNFAAPIDNKGNTPWTQVGVNREFTKWPGQGLAVYAFNSIVGGSNHTFSVNDANVWDEVTFSVVEVKNGGVVQDHKWNEVLMSTTQTSQSVTTTGPATLIAVWAGDDASAVLSNPVPNNGFTVIQGQGHSVEAMAMFVATKDVPGAGTYNVTWTTTPLQGAQLFLIAVQKR